MSNLPLQATRWRLLAAIVVVGAGLAGLVVGRLSAGPGASTGGAEQRAAPTADRSPLTGIAADPGSHLGSDPEAPPAGSSSGPSRPTSPAVPDPAIGHMPSDPPNETPADDEATTPIVAPSGPLPWPLSIEIAQSSSFAEYRGGRFHGGIDLRTRGTTGHPVIAVADGFVSRLKVERRGFGNAIYLDHPALGLRVVYGHLERFAEPMAGWVAQQRRDHRRRYGHDGHFKADRFPVRRGDVVGYTGESGVGPAHLHFETRNLADHPIAPSFFGWRTPDELPPQALAVYFVPLGPSARIDGQFKQVRVGLAPAGRGRLRLERPVRVGGQVGVLAGLLDTSAAGNRFGVETVRLRIGGAEVFARQFDRFTYDTNRQAVWVYDAPLSDSPGTGYVYHLFRWPWESLPMRATPGAWAGAAHRWPTGRQSLAIDAIDFGGRAILIEGTVEVCHSETDETAGPQTPSAADDDAVPAGVDIVGVESNAAGLIVTMAGRRPPSHPAPRRSRSPGSGTHPPGTFQPGCGTVVVRNAGGQLLAVPSAMLPDGRMQVLIPPEQRYTGATLNELPLFPPGATLIDATGAQVASPDGQARAEFPNRGLRQPMWVFFAPATGFSGAAGLPVRSPAWRLHPANLVADQPFTVAFTVPAGLSAERLGIFSHGPGGSLGYEGGDRGRNGWLTCTARWTWPMALVEDTVPPTVKALGDGSHPDLGACWRFAVGDRGKGLDDDRFTVRLEGRPADWEFDPDTGVLYVVRVPPTKGSTGKRDLEVVAVDRAGHRTGLVVKR